MFSQVAEIPCEEAAANLTAAKSSNSKVHQHKHSEHVMKQTQTALGAVAKGLELHSQLLPGCGLG